MVAVSLDKIGETPTNSATHYNPLDQLVENAIIFRASSSFSQQRVHMRHVPSLSALLLLLH
jgi:hypothetical protein